MTPNSNVEITRARQNDDAKADHHADDRQPHALEDDHVLDLRRLRAEREADADLLRPLLHRVRHQAVDADCRQQQRRRAEHRHQPHVEPLARRRERHDLGHRAHVGDRQPRGLPELLLDRRSSPSAARPACAPPTPSASRLTLSAFAASGTCACGMYIVGSGSLFRPPSRVSPTTPMIWRSGSSANSRMTPRPITSAIVQRIALGPELPRHRLVDDHDAGGARWLSRSVNVRPRLTGILNTSK